VGVVVTRREVPDDGGDREGGMNIQTTAMVLGRYTQTPYSRVIDPADAMWATGPDWYWSVGESGMKCILKGLLASPILPQPGSILDLACGHGCVGRHIRAAFSSASIFWCDVAGADFCAREFGGEAIRSERELLNVSLPKVDAIWVGSLFTHVPEARAGLWLNHIAQALNPGGVLIATFHGRITAKLYREMIPSMVPMLDRLEPQHQETGWGFEAYNPATDPDWGMSLSRIDRLAFIGAAVPDTKIGSITEGGWAANQDVLVLLKNTPQR
jgi:SAM-dependent methyltransferase